MKKPALAVFAALLVAVLAAIFVIKARQANPLPPEEPEEISLPVNTIPISERPFVTLTPDQSGRNLTLFLDNTSVKDIIEYELVYQSGDKQEGAFGRLDLTRESLPVSKELLLGSQSGGGKITYHEGVTGGSLTLTYDQTKLKEQFNFLRFDPQDPVVTSSDVRFSVEFAKTALAKDSVVVVMKPFGLPAELAGQLVAGPYALLTASAPKGQFTVELKLPAGQHTNPTIHAYDASEQAWTPLKTTLEGDAVSATPAIGSVFIVTSD